MTELAPAHWIFSLMTFTNRSNNSTIPFSKSARPVAFPSRSACEVTQQQPRPRLLPNWFQGHSSRYWVSSRHSAGPFFRRIPIRLGEMR